MNRRPRIIPCLSIDSNQGLVKTQRFSKPRYLGDPINAVKIFNRKGVDELSILDIEASKNNRGPNFSFLQDVATEAFMPLSYGGGITELDQIRKLFSIGYEKVIINTSFIKKPQLITQAVDYAGSQSIVVSIDYKKQLLGKNKCFVNDGLESVNSSPLDMAVQAERLGAGEVLLNSMINDGMMCGYDIETIKSVSDAVSIPLIACGGARDVSDLKKALTDGHADAVAGGSMFVYYGRGKAVLITFPEEQELIQSGIFKAI